MRLPLSGVRVIELAGLAPVPFAGLQLTHFGASVTRVDRVVDGRPAPAHPIGAPADDAAQ